MSKRIFDYTNSCSCDDFNFRRRVGGGMTLYHYLIYVCTLGDKLPELLSQWASDIFYRCYPVITTKLDAECENIDRVRVIEEEMMQPMMGVYFEDYDSDQFVRALKFELDRLNRKNNADVSLMKREILCIDSVLTNIGNYVDQSKSRIEHFYDEFKEATRRQSLDMLIESIEKFTGIPSCSLKSDIDSDIYEWYKKHGFYSVDDFFELMRDEYGYCIGSEQKTRYKSCEFKGFECMENITTDEERQVLNKRYANVKLDRIPPRSEWYTVDELRAELHKKIKELYSK